ncbi:MAG: deoxyribonuclease IV [Gemmatimonadetes bacterium]|jgi:deoxyribonuclease-4|nr:deoxyribonuclease IV [Gemmatimonadota bacterium]MBT4611090.1 deoxyribonuclease IV [Gemmatimonadota bacterium]MBT5060123.1 deoxyribonuclease IV [Gemmatimonadota bacterium]MBT5144209.1 deoxyribonuclease IV [Gemmatimonadota bacterium]MBT5588765.1 deoxyribonuclease IV [Gemmatimonadota bacterium]
MIFGAHESIAGGVDLALDRGQRATCDAIQIFNKSNSQWKARPLDADQVERYFAAIEATQISVACSHASYLINLASPDRSLNEKSQRAFRTETERCNLLSIPNLVFHPGSHVGSGADAGMKRIARNMNRVLDQVTDNSVTLCLEATAGTGDNLGRTFEELAQIIDLIDDTEHVGVCLDTCHIFAAGYGLRDEGEYKQTMKEFGSVVGFDKLRIVHVNDSKTEQGSHRDRHEHIGEGCIGLDGFHHLVNDRRLRKVPLILETPKSNDLSEDVTNLKLLRSLMRKAP